MLAYVTGALSASESFRRGELLERNPPSRFRQLMLAES